MLDGPSVVAALVECGVTHLVWIPDSELGLWEDAILAEPRLQLVRVCREGEAIAVAAGLLIGGKRPIVLIQCTGFFEAGDALRNFVHDLKLPLFLVVGVRSYYGYQQKTTSDTCPVYTEPIVQAWGLRYQIFERTHTAGDLAAAYQQAQSRNEPAVVLLAE
jgi:sulfopyruvate decarboxylase TPP-binding subunit